MLNSSIDQESLFKYLLEPMTPYNAAYRAAAERCIELFKEYLENPRISTYFAWYKVYMLYESKAQYGLAHTTIYHAEAHNKLLQDIADVYKELFFRLQTIIKAKEWDKKEE